MDREQYKPREQIFPISNGSYEQNQGDDELEQEGSSSTGDTLKFVLLSSIHGARYTHLGQCKQTLSFSKSFHFPNSRLHKPV